MPKLIGNKYYTLITDIGEAKIANNLYSGKKIDFALLKLGNGNDEEYNPDSSQTDLRKEVWRGNVVHVEIDEKNPNWINIYTVIPPGDGGFWIREMGVFDSDGDMIAICNVAPSYKPTLDEGSAKEITMKMTMAVTNTSVITLKVDPTVIYAKRKDVISLQTRVNDITAQLNDLTNDRIYYCGTTTGTNAYIVTNNKIKAYTEGLTVRVKIGTASTGASTLNINGLGAKTILDSLGNAITSGGLKAELMYQLSYNGTNFIVLGKGGGGNATSDQVLINKTFTNDSGLQNGTMPNRGAVTATLNAGGSYTIPAGYHNGSGKVTAKSLATQMANNGVTLTSASQLISGIKAYSKSGALLTGTATIQSLGGLQSVSGSFVSDGQDNMSIDIGVKPKILVIRLEEGYYSYFRYIIIFRAGMLSFASTSSDFGYLVGKKYTNSNSDVTIQYAYNYCTLTDTGFTINNSTLNNSGNKETKYTCFY